MRQIERGGVDVGGVIGLSVATVAGRHFAGTVIWRGNIGPKKMNRCRRCSAVSFASAAAPRLRSTASHVAKCVSRLLSSGMLTVT